MNIKDANPMEKWAAIDIGSNTVQLLVAGSADIHFRPHLFALRTTRLGDSSRPGLLAPERIEATLAVLQEYREMLITKGVTALRAVATSAVRDAANRAMLLTAVRELCGWQIEVLSGQEEARLSFLGAAAGALAAGARQILLLDIGGSSSELVRWRNGLLQSVSANLGAVRARVADWPSAEIDRLLAAVIQAEDDDKDALAIGAGGTITTAAALLQGCRSYSREAVEGYRLQTQGVEELLATLQPLTIEQRCVFSPLLEQRGEIICEGLLIVRAFFRLLTLPSLTVSTGGILEGCLADLKKRGLSPLNKLTTAN